MTEYILHTPDFVYLTSQKGHTINLDTTARACGPVVDIDPFNLITQSNPRTTLKAYRLAIELTNPKNGRTIQVHTEVLAEQLPLIIRKDDMVCLAQYKVPSGWSLFFPIAYRENC